METEIRGVARSWSRWRTLRRAARLEFMGWVRWRGAGRVGGVEDVHLGSRAVPAIPPAFCEKISLRRLRRARACPARTAAPVSVQASRAHRALFGNLIRDHLQP